MEHGPEYSRDQQQISRTTQHENHGFEVTHDHTCLRPDVWLLSVQTPALNGRSRIPR